MGEASALGPSRREVLEGAGAALALSAAAPALSALADVPTEPATVAWPNPSVIGNAIGSATAKDDFYAYVNAEWMGQASLPEGYPRWGTFLELALAVKEDGIRLLETDPETKYEDVASTIYRAALDWEKRDSAGFAPLMDLIEALLGAASVQDIVDLYLSDKRLLAFTTLLTVCVEPDVRDSSTNIITIDVPTLSLDDSAEYIDGLTDFGEPLHSAWSAFLPSMLQNVGIDETRALQLAEAHYDFERQLAQYIYPVEESYKNDWAERTYNPVSPEELAALCPALPILDILDFVGCAQRERISVKQPAFIEGLNGMFRDENLEGIRAFLIGGILFSLAKYADSKSTDAYVAYGNTAEGSSGREADEKLAYSRVEELAAEILGYVYGTRCFGEEAREDVEAMVDKMTDVFRLRIDGAEWLGEETRRMALQKLDAMTRRLGYPRESDLRYAWDELELDEGTSLIELAVQITEWKNEQEYAEAGKPVRREVWPMSAVEVNACYLPSDNSVTFPAAVLAAPFYSRDASASANYGAIGAAIGHEMTHAFDNDGSQYDAEGNLSNWWTDDDRAAFASRTARVRERFESVEPVEGVHVEGDLVLGEAVADLGGVACCLQILDGMDDPNYEEFFRSWAVVWRQIMTPEYSLNALKNDPHPPAYLRVDIILQQFQQFYDTFGIEEGDFMYVPEEERLQVW